MSVAFRREQDDEHLEPHFELPLPPGPNLVTERGLALIEAKVAELEAAIVAEADAEALKKLRRQARYWSTRKATARVAPPPPADQVAFGSTVTFRHNGATRTVTLVGHDEADPTAGTIAFTAPLARALIGATEGEQVDFAGRTEAIEVLAVTG